jgi:hypothetical protein
LKPHHNLREEKAPPAFWPRPSGSTSSVYTPPSPGVFSRTLRCCRGLGSGQSYICSDLLFPKVTNVRYRRHVITYHRYGTSTFSQTDKETVSDRVCIACKDPMRCCARLRDLPTTLVVRVFGWFAIGADPRGSHSRLPELEGFKAASSQGRVSWMASAYFFFTSVAGGALGASFSLSGAIAGVRCLASSRACPCERSPMQQTHIYAPAPADPASPLSPTPRGQEA